MRPGSQGAETLEKVLKLFSHLWTVSLGAIREPNATTLMPSESAYKLTEYPIILANVM